MPLNPAALLESLGPSALKGLGMGAGMALPGAMLINHLGNRMDESVDHARNQALLTALGGGAMAAGGMALQRKLSPKGVETSTEGEGPMGPYKMLQRTKMSYDEGYYVGLERLGFKVARENPTGEFPAMHEAPHPMVGKTLNMKSLVNKGPDLKTPTNFANSKNLVGKTLSIKSLVK